jgi:ankyrin repeat protein
VDNAPSIPQGARDFEIIVSIARDTGYRFSTLLLLQDGWTPLYVAAGNGHLPVVGQLLGAGAALDAANKVGPHVWWGAVEA